MPNRSLPWSAVCIPFVIALALAVVPAASLLAQTAIQQDQSQSPPCTAENRYFADEVWAKVGERVCLKCHNAQGDAADSDFILQPATRDPAATVHNCANFARLAKEQENGQSRLLQKVIGGLDHGGGAVLKPDSAGYRILEQYVRRLEGKASEASLAKAIEAAQYNAPPFFEGVVPMSPERLLRRVTFSLAARLPSAQEREAVAKDGLSALNPILDQLMTEEAFYFRLQEGFNDIFLTRGFEDNAETILSYEHFEKTRLWYQKHNLDHIPEKDRQKAHYKLADDYREAIHREPLELIKYIVRHDRPFTELVTADYILVSPYTARGYGLFEQMQSQFKNPEDPFEYLPAKLPALKNRSGKVQESASGFYPHAGMLSTFHYLRRYPTTDTNRNRLRARMYYLHFLGIDIMELAPRVTDAAAVGAKFEIPTMQAADCVVCHKTIDPVAGLFQDYVDKDNLFGQRKGGWYTDMFTAGLEREKLADEERWRSLPWLGERTARDPRFAAAMVEHVYYILTGRKVLQPPGDIEDPLFNSKRRAYQEQRRLIEDTSREFAAANFNLKLVFKLLINSDFYRVDGLATAAEHPRRQAELDDLGLVRMLSPEQLERKLNALFGKSWGRLDHRGSQFKILYGGIDSQSVTERMADPSGAMGAIQRIMANDMACKNVPLDFTKPASERRLFPQIELNVVPEDNPESEQQVRQAIVHLHAYLLGQQHAIDHPEVQRTYELFLGILHDSKERKGWDKQDSYFCRGADDKRVDDPQYTLRAWRGVVTYLLRQYDFLYE